MAVVISGTNNNDRITATDGTIDLLSGVNFNTEITVPSFKVGSDIQFGNAGIITATTLVGNVTGNINHTSNLLLQISGSEKFRVGTSGQLGIGGANYGTSGQVLTSGGSSSAATWSTISGTTINNNANNRIITGSGTANTLEAETSLEWNGTDTLTVVHPSSYPDFKVRTSAGGGSFEMFSCGNGPFRIRSASTSPDSSADELVVGATSGDRGLTIFGSSNNICFGDADDSDIGRLQYVHSDNSMRFFTNTSERLRINSNGAFGLGGATYGSSGQVLTSAGSGSVPTWTTVSGTTINNNTDNYVITGTGTANTLNGEANLTFETSTSGGTLTVAGTSEYQIKLKDTNSSGNAAETALAFTDSGDTIQGFVGFNYWGDGNLDIQNNNSGGSVCINTGGGNERLRIDSNGSVGINIANPGSYDPNAESLVVGEISGGDGNSGITIVSGATDKQGAIYFADGTASASYRGRIEYNHNTDTLGLGAGGSGYMYELTSNKHFQAGNFCINPSVHNSSSTKYNQINSDNHANTLFGLNCHLGTSGSSGNHKIIQSNSHGSIGCAGILIGGNGSNNNSRIAFFAFPQGNSAGHDFGQDAWRMRINKDGDMIEVKTPQNSGNAGMIIFRDGNHDFCGQITSNGANNTTSYNTSSDYRLKTNEALITDGITRIKNLKPYQFEWKSDLGIKVDGFFAHEAQTVVPESVVGTKDEVDSDNNPVYQGIDQSKLVPLLTAALQEAITKIETLEAEVAALKSS